MVWWVARFNPHGGPMELFLVSASVPQLRYGAYKRSFAANLNIIYYSKKIGPKIKATF